MICSASPLKDDGSLSGQLEAVRLNGVCTMEMVKFLMEMVTKLSCEIQLLKNDNTDLKSQLRDLQLSNALPPFIPSGAVSVSAPATSAPTYGDILTSAGAHPACTAVSSTPILQPTLPASSADIQAVDGFITVQKKRKVNHPSSVPSGVPKPSMKPRTLLIGNKNGSSLPTVPKKVRTKALFVS
jgi:hypothetical protein